MVLKDAPGVAEMTWQYGPPAPESGEQWWTGFACEAAFRAAAPMEIAVARAVQGLPATQAQRIIYAAQEAVAEAANVAMDMALAACQINAVPLTWDDVPATYRRILDAAYSPENELVDHIRVSIGNETAAALRRRELDQLCAAVGAV